MSTRPFAPSDRCPCGRRWAECPFRDSRPTKPQWEKCHGKQRRAIDRALLAGLEKEIGEEQARIALAFGRPINSHASAI